MRKSLPLLVLLSVAAGCVTTVETPGSAPEARQPKVEKFERKTVYDKRIIVDPALAKTIRIVGVKASVNGAGFFKIQVDVQSTTEVVQQFAYKIEWFDAGGFALPMAATTLPWTLLPHETSFLAATCPTPSGKDFRIVFIPPND